jgi:lipopolysaccharide transport system permease protein
MIRLGFRHYKNLIVHKAWADFRAEAERTYLGVVWWVLDPLINMAIYYLVFGVFLRMGTHDYIPFLLTGLVVWRFIEATVVRASNSILTNVAMVRQVAFRKIIFPLIAVGTCVMEYVFSLALLFAVLLMCGYRPGVTWLAVPLLLAVELALVLAMSLPLAVVVTFVPDVGKLISQMLRILFYLSGIFYSINRLPQPVVPWLKLNPAVHIVEGMRDALMHGVWPNWTALGAGGLLSVLVTAGGWALVGHFDPLFAKRIAR